ncbi:hypothetical protein KORDIASMS9_02836 [Kordia sp. SMS9]|uniref:hypothetical protein n=1 Tax=Kordia sp. SMS9 TaxID=2282170 RepID=UPI000E0D87EC|nr:hypothetical protein [Kordia sp. SMS9]AXG70596.1 hypothetical protein KORDIASMS9_02836 [Kordia sp. SMS9]
MATATVKQNGTAKKTQSTVAVKTSEKAKATSATKKLVQEVIPPVTKPISLHDRMNNFEKLNGLANQRTRLMTTLTSLTKFKYNNGDSCVFLIRDENGEEFKTTNTNLIQLVTNHLQDTLLHRKEEIEKKIVQFEL